MIDFSVVFGLSTHIFNFSSIACVQKSCINVMLCLNSVGKKSKLKSVKNFSIEIAQSFEKTKYKLNNSENE